VIAYAETSRIYYRKIPYEYDVALRRGAQNYEPARFESFLAPFWLWRLCKLGNFELET
jgi:hypothetical protein